MLATGAGSDEAPVELLCATVEVVVGSSGVSELDKIVLPVVEVASDAVLLIATVCGKGDIDPSVET